MHLHLKNYTSVKHQVLTCRLLKICWAKCHLIVIEAFNSEYVDVVWRQRVDRAHHGVWTKGGKSNRAAWGAFRSNCDLVRGGTGDLGPPEDHRFGCCRKRWHLHCCLHKWNKCHFNSKTIVEQYAINIRKKLPINNPTKNLQELSKCQYLPQLLPVNIKRKWWWLIKEIISVDIIF